MNILFFLTPKSDVAYLFDDYTVRQALEKMERQRYTSIPVISRQGCYIGTITEGDLLWALKSISNFSFKDVEKLKISDITHHSDNTAVGINDQMENLLQLAMNQNFVPVVNDDKIFIGIVTRKAIMQYCYGKYIEQIQDNQ